MAGKAEIKIPIVGDASKYKAALDDAEKHTSGFSDKLGKIAVAGVAALGASAVAIGVDSLKAFEGVAGAVSKLQRLTGGTAEDMSHLAFQAKESGVAQETLEKSLTKMSKAMVAGSPAFTKLGVDAKDANGNLRPMGDVMADLAEKFKAMPAGAEKNALAMQLFGKSGTDMLPMLNKGKEGLNALSEEADKFGITIGQDGVDAYKKNVKNGREMHAAMEGLKIQIGEKLMPVITTITTWMAENLPKATAVVKSAIEKLTPVFDAIGQAIAALTEWWSAHWDEIQAKITDVIGYIKGFIDTFISVVSAAWDTFGATIVEFIKGHLEAARDVFKGIFDTLQAIWTFFKDLFTGQWGKLWGDVVAIVTGFGTIIKGALEGIWTDIKAVAGVVWDAIKATIGGAIDSVVGFVTGIPGRIASTVSGLWDGIKTGITDAKDWVSDRIDDVVNFAINLPSRMAGIFSGMWDGIKNAFKSAVNAIIRFWNGLEFKVPGFHIGPIGYDGFTLGLPDIKQMKEGGLVRKTPGGILARLGEGNFDELVIPLNGTNGMGDTFNIIINTPPGQDPQQTAKALRQYQRRGGRM